MASRCCNVTRTSDVYCACAAAVLGSGVPGADEKRVAQVMGAIADRVTDQFINPYTFPSSHKRILEPYNYYDFGQVHMDYRILH